MWVGFFGLEFNSLVNTFSHVEPVSLPNHIFSLGRLSPLNGKPVPVLILLPETANFLNQQKGENNHTKYFMINVHKRMLPGPAGI